MPMDEDRAIVWQDHMDDIALAFVRKICAQAGYSSNHPKVQALREPKWGTTGDPTYEMAYSVRDHLVALIAKELQVEERCIYPEWDDEKEEYKHDT
jgi:hypothetical protein